MLKKSEAVGTVIGSNGFTSRTEFLYDAKGRMTESKQTTSGTWNSDLVVGTVKYDYNGADQVEDVTYPSLRKARTCGNQMGQTVSVSGLALNGYEARAYASGGLYEGDGGLKEITIGGLKETRTYNAKRQVEGIALATTGGNARWSLTNHYCDFAVDCATNNGNIMKQEISQPKPQAEGGATISFTVNYQYDALNRLTSAQEPAVNGSSLPWGQTFDYDRYGNRWMTGAVGGVPSGVPNGPDWFEPTKNQIKGTGITHDAAGHLTAMGTGSHLLAWDTEGRKVEDQITSAGTEFKTWYAYDAEGRRVRRQTADGAWKVFVYDGRGRLAAEMESVDGPVTETRMMYGDHLGSTRVVAGLDGVVVKRYDYMPFGEEVQADVSGRSELEYGGGGVAQRFTGKERDEGLMEARMDYFGPRYLGSVQGRFTSPDAPFADQHAGDPQSWNLYAYAGNNPLRYFDPTGRAFCSYGSGGPPEAGPATEEKTCTDGGGSWVYQPTDTDDPNADAPHFQFSVTKTEKTGELDAKGQAVVNQLAENADSTNALIGTVIGGAVTIGAVAGAIPAAAPATLYHYTSAAAHQAIIQSGQLIPGIGVSGFGVYTTVVRWPWTVAWAQRPTQAVVSLSPGLVPVRPSLILPFVWWRVKAPAVTTLFQYGVPINK